MKLRRERDNWKDAAPHRAAFKAAVLIDDIVHKGVSRVSDSVQRRGFDKRKQAYLAVTAGIAAATYLWHGEADSAKSMMINFQNWTVLSVSLASFEPLSEKPVASGQAAASRREGFLAKVARLPILLGSAASLVYGCVSEKASVMLSSGFTWGAFAVGLYILSSSTGIVDRLLESLSNLRLGIPAAEPVRIRK